MMITRGGAVQFSKTVVTLTYKPFVGSVVVDIQPKTKLYNHLGFLFSDFRIKLFVDPKPVKL